MTDKTEHIDFRTEKRMPLACSVYIHGITKNEERIKINSVTENISLGGLFLRTPQVLKLGSSIFTLTQLISGAKLATRGSVIRIEQNKHQLPGLVIRINHHKFISA